MSGNNFYGNSPIGEWNGPPNGANSHMQNGYGMSNGDSSIGMFQMPPSYNNQFNVQHSNMNNSAGEYQPASYGGYGGPTSGGNGFSNGFSDQMRGAYARPPGTESPQQGHVPSTLARVAQGIASQQVLPSEMLHQHINGHSAMNGHAHNGHIGGPPHMNGMNGHTDHQMAQSHFSEAPQQSMKPFDNTFTSSGSLPSLPTSVSDPILYQQLHPGANSITSGINFDNYDNIPIDVKGDNVPSPMTTFREAQLHQYVQYNVDMSGYVKPTPVQKHAIPTLCTGRDLMACAQTGSGKTAAFLLPIINQIVNTGAMPYKEVNPTTRRFKQFPFALILSPTRELAMQIHKEATKFSFKTNVMTVMFYGGRENYRDQLNKSRNGCHIVIATPGRLIDVINQGYLSLEHCKFLVLDEADRMLDMGFEPQIRKIVSLGLPNKMARQTAMFSATFPKEIKTLAEDFLNPNFVHLAVGRVGSTSENIEQNILWVDEAEKRGQLQRIIDAEDPSALVLVFVETRRAANDLASQLQRAGLRAVAIHGDLKQPDRERNLELFRNGSNPILVATAVAARGLDIPNVKHVINFDMPNDVDEYVHRIGRTGRCGNAGTASSFFTEKNRALGRDLLAVLNEANQVVPEWLPPIAASSQNPRNNKFMRGGRGRGSFQSNSRGGFGAPRGFGGAPRGSGIGRANGLGGMMAPMGTYGFGGPGQQGVYPGPFPPNGLNPMQFTPQQMPFGMQSGRGFRGNGFGGNAGGRGGFGAPRGGGFRGGMPQPPMFGMRPMPGMGDWQPRTAPVPN